MTLLVRTAGNSFPMEVSWRFFNLAQPIVEFEENRPQGDIATLQIRLLIYACASQKACFYAASGLTLEMDCHEFIFPPFSMPKFEAVLGHLKLATTSFGRDPE